MHPRSVVLAFAALLSSPLSLCALDSAVEGRRLVIVDGGASGRSKVVYAAKGAAVGKGAGTDANAISMHVEIARGGVVGSFSVPAGAADADGNGWTGNDGAAARYGNSEAASGVPTGVRKVVLKVGKVLRLSAKTLGDQPIDFDALSADANGVRVVASVQNGADLRRHCAAFAAASIKVVGPSPSGRRKLVARRGVPVACPGIVLDPAPALPAVPATPYLYFDGGDAGALAELAVRVGHAATAGFYNSFRSFADGNLANIGSVSDDSHARIAKATGLLHVLGEVPSGGSGFASYRDAAVAALLSIGDRTALDSVDEFINPPANLLNVLQDSGRLQSMSEAYDFLRGSGVAPVDDAAIRDRIANWADAFVGDWNLTGDPFGVFAGHRDNWGVKAGAALVTAALSLPGHPSAALWLSTGVGHLNASLGEVVMSPGWYSESPHYVNYSLNNLAPAAWHVRNAAAVDWFDDLAPLVDVSLALRQPDGESAAFEEGVSNVFPHDVLAAAYPTRAPRMLWAWQQSSQEPVNFDNQQIHSVTRFLTVDTSTAAAAPSEAPTVFLGGDTNAAALRSSWDADAIQLTSMTAVDHSDSELFASRHNTENPLDVVLFAAGGLLLPTAGGGPQVTSSVNRAVYLEPGSKNIPLVDGDAPYILDPLRITFGERLDSADAGGVGNRLLDTATTTVSDFAAGVDVTRTVGLVSDSFAVVVDRFTGTAAHSYGLTWRGRGDSTVRSLSAPHLGVDYAWPDAATPSAHLAIDVTGSAPLTGVVDSGLYAPVWGSEETLAPLRASTSASHLHVLSVLRPRLDASPSTVIANVGSGDVVAFRVTDGPVDHLMASRGGTAFVVDGASSDAELAIVRRESGVATALAMVRGTYVESGASIESSAATTLSMSVESGSAQVAVTADRGGKVRLTLENLPGMAMASAHAATFDGVPLVGGDFVQTATGFKLRLGQGGTVVIVPLP